MNFGQFKVEFGCTAALKERSTNALLLASLFCICSSQCSYSAPAKAKTAGAAASSAPAGGSTAGGAPAGAAKQSGPNPALTTYVNQLRPKIDKNWNFPNGQNHVILSVDVAADGSVTNLVLTSTPKNSDAEQKASDAFNGAQPLPALPSGGGAKLVVTFDSQADQWNSKSNIQIKLDPVKAASSSAPAEDKPADKPASETQQN